MLQERFYCPGQELLLREVMKSCVTCLARKALPTRNKAEMKHRPICSKIMGCLAIDHLFIDAKSNFKVLTVVDEATRFLWAIPVTSLSAQKTVKSLIKNIFCVFGYPDEVHSDNSSSFVNGLMDELMQTCGIKHTKSSAYHSMGNSVCERANQSILNLLGTLSDKQKEKWQLQCEKICFAYNCSIHDATGYTPFELMFGRTPKLVPDHVLGLSMLNCIISFLHLSVMVLCCLMRAVQHAQSQYMVRYQLWRSPKH